MSTVPEPMSGSVPTPKLAAALAAKIIGLAPVGVTRFTTGERHYVYEVGFAGRPPVVVRIGDGTAQAEMAGAVELSGLLRPRGVPLPALLAHDVTAELPWMMLERLAGNDLGAVFAALTDPQLARVAAGVAAAQAVVAATPTAGRYGYAVRADLAPFGNWTEVLAANVERSRRRITAHGLFDPALAGRLQNLLAAHGQALSRVAATPFLHDTTTKNVIVGPDGTLSGIVDVDNLCFGDPRYPAALTMAVLLAYYHGRTDYVAAWLGQAGQADDGLFGLYVALFVLDLMAEHGGVFNGNEVASQPAARAGLLRAFEEAVGSAN